MKSEEGERRWTGEGYRRSWKGEREKECFETEMEGRKKRKGSAEEIQEINTGRKQKERKKEKRKKNQRKGGREERRRTDTHK